MSESKTKSKSLENLQKALSMELTASHQYLLHAHLLDDWGLDKLAEKMRGRGPGRAWTCQRVHQSDLVPQG